jgi:hypothetical protein
MVLEEEERRKQLAKIQRLKLKAKKAEQEAQLLESTKKKRAVKQFSTSVNKIEAKKYKNNE